MRVDQKWYQKKNFSIMNLKYLKIARDEFHDAIKYYETQQIDLGIKFQSDVKSSIKRIKNFLTLMWQLKKILEDVYFINSTIVFYIQSKITTF